MIVIASALFGILLGISLLSFSSASSALSVGLWTLLSEGLRTLIEF